MEGNEKALPLIFLLKDKDISLFSISTGRKILIEIKFQQNQGKILCL